MIERLKKLGSHHPGSVRQFDQHRNISQFTPIVLWQTVSGPFGATVTAQVPDLGTPGLTVYRVVAVTEMGGFSAPSTTSLPKGKFTFESSAPTPHKQRQRSRRLFLVG